MQTQLKFDEFSDDKEAGLHYDAHIKDYQSKNLGIKVVFCDNRGAAVSNSLAPLSAYMPNTSYNM